MKNDECMVNGEEYKEQIRSKWIKNALIYSRQDMKSDQITGDWSDGRRKWFRVFRKESPISHTQNIYKMNLRIKNTHAFSSTNEFHIINSQISHTCSMK